MKLSEELTWRGFVAETTIKDLTTLDQAPRHFYFGADPSADSLTIGNLAALMMCACFIRHGHHPHFLVGGATGQIGDPKDNGERELKPLEEVEHNKKAIAAQIIRVTNSDPALRLLDNYDWFKDIQFLPFLREIGKAFSMTQLLDRQFVQARIGEGGSGISYAEFSYTLIQGYDFLHLYRNYGVDLQLCGADQFGNCTSGIHLIKRLENATADAFSCPLVIDPASGRKFGKSEGNAIWLDSKKTSIFDFYQFWLNQPDSSVEYLLKIYTTIDKSTIEDLLTRHAENPAERLAQKALAKAVTEIVHGATSAEAAANLTELLFGGKDINTLSESAIAEISMMIPSCPLSNTLVDTLVSTGLASSKTVARQLIEQGAISVNGVKTVADTTIASLSIIKKGKNKFALVK